MVLGSLATNSTVTHRIVVVNIQNWFNHSPLISKSGIEILEKACGCLNIELEICELEVPETLASTIFSEYGHISIAAWAKVIALFSFQGNGGEELIYLDPDILLLKNFEEIFNLEVKATTSLMARPSNGHHVFENFWESHRDKYASKNSETKDWYFNSGVMKFKPQKWQNYQFWIDWTALMQHTEKYRIKIVDQDLLNALVLGNYEKLPVSFNCYPSEFKSETTRIIHFAGGAKPWYYRNMFSRMRLGISTKAAMQLWRKNEVQTMRILSKQVDRETFRKILQMKKILNKDFRFVVIQIFPSITRSKLLIRLNDMRKNS